MPRPIEAPEPGQDKSLTFSIAYDDWELLQTMIEEENTRTGYRLTVTDMLRRIVREAVRTRQGGASS